MKRTLVALCIAALILPGCATRNAMRAHPDALLVQGMIVDTKGKDKAQVTQDGFECAGIAQATAPGDKAMAGAIAGAVFGALLGAATWRAGGLSGNRGASFGGAVGGLTGAAEGAGAGAQDYRTVLRNCMIGRGHIPLN